MKLLALPIAFSALSYAYAGDSRAEITAIYAKMDKAYAKKNFNEYFTYFHPEYSCKRPDSVVKLKLLKADTGMFLGQLQKMSVSRKFAKFSPSGAAFVVETSSHLKGQYPPPKRRNGTGKPTAYEIITTQRDTWMKTGGAWQLRYSVILKTVPLVNGRPMTGAGVGG